MDEKNIIKYEQLEGDFFSTCPNWTYAFTIDGVKYELDLDDKTNKYVLWEEKRGVIANYKDIYEALDNVSFHGKTLKQLLLETDFNFDSIG